MHERDFLMMTHTSIWFLLEDGPERAGPKYVEDDGNNTYLLTYLLTARCRVLLQKLTG